MTIATLFKYITAKRIRQTLKQGLSIVGAFYMLDINYSYNILLHFKNINIETVAILEFLIVYGIILFIFYPCLDAVLRYIFLKKMKVKILKQTRKIKENNKTEALRVVSEYKQLAVDFVMNYPVGMGYITIHDMPKPIEEIKISDQEKDEAINEIVGITNKWICTFLHLLVTLLVVFKYSTILTYCLLGVLILLSPFVIVGIIVMVENMEIIGPILKELYKRKTDMY